MAISWGVLFGFFAIDFAIWRFGGPWGRIEEGRRGVEMARRMRRR